MPSNNQNCVEGIHVHWAFWANGDIVSDSILPWCSYGWVACCSCGIPHSESWVVSDAFAYLWEPFPWLGCVIQHWYNTMCPLLLWLVMLYLFDVPGDLVFCVGILGVGGDWGRGCGRRERNNSSHNAIYELCKEWTEINVAISVALKYPPSK